MSLRATHEVLHLALRDPFRIARTDHAEGDGVTTVIVELRDDRFPDVVGVGEGYPDRFYGETPETMAAIWPYLLSFADSFSVDLEDAASARQHLESLAASWDANVRWNGAAKCALDIAFHDFAGKLLGIPVHELIDLPAAIPPTDFTIGIDEPEIVAQRAARAADFPALKIKCGGPQDLATLRAVRAVFGGPIRVDANTGWTRDDAERLLPEIVDLGVELIEQPFPARAYRDLAWLQERSTIPIVADESAVVYEDLDALVGVVAGVNVKLAKCGGIGPAKAMLERARELGFKTFLGCMEETSVGIAGSAAVASLADWVDLDGCLLLADDPFEGLDLDADHRWILTSRPGLGLTRRGS
ncbi:MAG TPA: dipeptide epimerase [Candidatus Limnocylindrales bacterium]|jgi:L-alanine-DL-glutamate epimerase-like enolase superfamily enzyme